MICPRIKKTDLRYSAGHFVKSIHEAPDTKMLDIGDYWGFSMPSVAITLKQKILTPLLTKIAMFLAPFEGASSYHVLWAWLLIL